MAVILNALRALRPVRAAVRLTPELNALNLRFQAEHQLIKEHADEVRAAADRLGTEPYPEAMSAIRRVHEVLVNEVGPHEQAEERELYPQLDRLFGSPAVTATMSRGHAEIAHQIRRLGQLLDEIGAGRPDEADAADLRAVLYGLHAILTLHTAQEEESFLSLAEDDRAGQVSGLPVTVGSGASRLR